MKKKREPQLKPENPIDPRAIELLGRADRGEIPLKTALVELGISELQSRKGWALVSQRGSLSGALAAAKDQEAKKLLNAPNLTQQQEQEIINKRLHQNIIDGQDRAVQSAKLLGSRRDLCMWQPDGPNGVVIIEAPKSIPAITDYMEGMEQK
ncbi:MAG TPA: hypothetical protein VN577_08960 [Terriglobales bacterium]|nr:hypothetical protein [Terriglobales bacterium]